MKTRQPKQKTRNHEVRSWADFRRRFYPKAVEDDAPEFPDPEKVGEKLAKESLDRLIAALSAK